MDDQVSNTEKSAGVVDRKTSVSVPAGWADICADAQEATDFQHALTIRQAICLFWKAILWCMLLSTTLIMEGYDTVLISSFYAQPQFNKKYGSLQNDGTYALAAPWRSGLNNGAQVGEILGLYVSGWLAERYGARKVMMGALGLVVAFIFVPFFAPDVGTLLAGEVLCGLAWGTFQTIPDAYASELAPMVLRPYLCTYNNLCWVIGQLFGSGVLRGVLDLNNQWAYRIPFGLQWMWPVPIFIGILLAPESPYWLVRKGRMEDARHSQKRLLSRGCDDAFDTDKYMALVHHTNEIEKKSQIGTSYLDCFRGVDRRRSEIACVTWIVQTWCGSTFMGYSTNFYETAGLNPDNAFDLTIGQYALGIFGTLGSFYLMSRYGRRSIYLYGLCALFCLLLIVGCVSFSSSQGSGYAIGSMLLVFTFVYDLTVGPVCYALVAEIPSTRLKGKTIVLARNSYNIAGIVVNILSNYQLTAKPSGWGWNAKSGFFWAGMCGLCIMWTYFRLPEPKDRTYAELEILFQRMISARRFASTDLDILGKGETSNEELLKTASDDSERRREKITETLGEK